MNSHFGIVSNGHTVRFQRALAGPIERVWSSLTEPELLEKWFGNGVIAPHVRGPVHFEFGVEGQVTAYEPPHLLEYTWREPDAPSGSISNALVRFDLSEHGAKVQLLLEHSLLPDHAIVPAAAGWHTLLDRLRALLDGAVLPETRELYETMEVQYERHFSLAGSKPAGQRAS